MTEESTVKNHKSYFKQFVGTFMGIIVITIISLVFKMFISSAPSAKTAEEFLYLLATNPQEAYDTADQSFRDLSTYDDLMIAIDAFPSVKDFKSASFGQIIQSYSEDGMKTYSLYGNYTTNKNTSHPITVYMIGRTADATQNEVLFVTGLDLSNNTPPVEATEENMQTGESIL